MASMGAAFLRRKGLSTALVPDEWDNARGGVDVVIGTRSAVFAPCPGLVAVVVIDEHDELLKEERSPAWDATAVASERARLAGIPLICTSAVPSAQSQFALKDHIVKVKAENGWPRIIVVNLSDVPVAQSLLSSELLQAVGTSGETTVCVLNTKGKARLIVCKSCRHVQACPSCTSLLTYDDDNNLWCVRCEVMHGGVCLACGRAAFTVPRGGVSQLVSQIQASTRNPVIEISSDSPDDWSKGTVFIGTEAVLHRIPTADTVVFADIDRDLGAPRMTGAHEVLSMIAKAARMVGAKGSLVIQTRQVDNPLIVALSQTDVSTALQRRVPHIPVVLAPSLVQGPDAPPTLVQALQQLGQQPNIDVILLVRGGGSMVQSQTNEHPAPSPQCSAVLARGWWHAADPRPAACDPPLRPVLQ
jgi:primosomal protein N' (replication factor Y)